MSTNIDMSTDLISPLEDKTENNMSEGIELISAKDPHNILGPGKRERLMRNSRRAGRNTGQSILYYFNKYNTQNAGSYIKCRLILHYFYFN